MEGFGTGGPAVGTMPVAERFVSVNGEGPRAGSFSAFVRFRGCNLACSYCDTQWACQPGCPVEELDPGELASWVLGQQTPCATLTGGEPLLQPLLPELVRRLLQREGLTVEVETNGACGVEELAALRAAGPGTLALTLDCKAPSSGMAGQMLESNYALLGADDCVKFVVGSEADLEAAAQAIECHGLLERCPVYLSPVFAAIEPAAIVGFLQERGLLRARVQLQLHKLIWPGVEKGV